ncbi:MAG: dockerin type I domain-containing protein [Planctomycetota bacterium]
MPKRRPLAVVSASALVAACAAQANEVVFDCTIDQVSSTVLQSVNISSPFSGTLRGNYDAVDNPTGTLTIPGLFGGSGNNPIPYTASIVVDGDIETAPTGSLRLGIDSEGLQIRVSNLVVDLLGGETGALGTTLNINYATFRTQNPSSVFPGGVTIPVPLGDATVSAMRATQVGDPVFGSLAATKTPGTYTFNVAIPVEFVIEADAFGQPVADGTPVAGVLPVSGLLVEGEDSALVSIAIANESSQTQPLETDPFVDLPLALPTVFPTGGTANLLMNGDFTSVSTTNSIDADIIANGVRVYALGDINRDGVVDLLDLNLLLAAWGSKGGPADLDASGRVNARDLSILLGAWN